MPPNDYKTVYYDPNNIILKENITKVDCIPWEIKDIDEINLDGFGCILNNWTEHTRKLTALTFSIRTRTIGTK